MSDLTDEFLDRIIAEAKAFRPKFTFSESIDEVADAINKPHDDYPLRVEKTKSLIQHFVNYNCTFLTEFDILSMHSHLFAGDGFNDKCIERGAYRKIQVKIENSRGETIYNPPEPYQIKWLIDTLRLFPVGFSGVPAEHGGIYYHIQDEISLVEWYQKFETIHPFQDGNGRVGGIVVAIISKQLLGKFMMPLQ